LETATVRFRRRLARKLWPDVFVQVERGSYLEGLIYDLRWWCSEFDDVAAAARWARASVASRYRAPGTPALEHASGISEFREKLRRRHRRDSGVVALGDCH
jgi:hypothetical protein